MLWDCLVDVVLIFCIFLHQVKDVELRHASISKIFEALHSRQLMDIFVLILFAHHSFREVNVDPHWVRKHFNGSSLRASVTAEEFNKLIADGYVLFFQLQCLKK